MAVIPMETDRLILRKVERRDAPLYFERIASRDAVTKTMLWSTHQSQAETDAVIEKILRRYDDSGYHRWAIAWKEDDTIIGVAELLRFTEDGSCSFAYMIGEDFWGRGCATESLRAIFAYAFDRLGIQTITADHFSDNPASGRVMQKLGMRHTGTVSNAYEKDGILHDAEAYTLTKADFFGAVTPSPAP